MDDQQRADMALDQIEAESDAWAIEVHLMPTIKRIAHVSRLAQTVPRATREKMISRQEALMDAMMRQAFIEGALRTLDLMNKHKSSKGAGE